MAAATSYDSVEELLETRANESVHLECPRETIDRAVRFVHERYARRRCAFYLITDRGFDRETVRSYLKFFARLAGGASPPTTRWRTSASHLPRAPPSRSSIPSNARS